MIVEWSDTIASAFRVMAFARPYLRFGISEAVPTGLPEMKKRSHQARVVPILRPSLAKTLSDPCPIRHALGRSIPDYEFQQAYPFTSLPVKPIYPGKNDRTLNRRFFHFQSNNGASFLSTPPRSKRPVQRECGSNRAYAA